MNKADALPLKLLLWLPEIISAYRTKSEPKALTDMVPPNKSTRTPKAELSKTYWQPETPGWKQRWARLTSSEHGFSPPTLTGKGRKGTYLRKAAMFSFTESEAFSTFMDLEQTYGVWMMSAVERSPVPVPLPCPLPLFSPYTPSSLVSKSPNLQVHPMLTLN